MKTYKILFLVGKDRPGIVDMVSDFLFKHKANIEDSRMAVLGGCFSIMALFSCNREVFESIKVDAKRIERQGFTLSFHEADTPGECDNRSASLLKLGVRSMDHPGIVKGVVHLLNQNKVNIQSLKTEVTHAPLSGAQMFDLSLEAGVPAGISRDKLKKDLSRLSMDMDLDLNYSGLD